MSENENKELVKKIMDKYGRTYAEELGIKLENSPSSLFRLLVSSMLFSKRISAKIAVKAWKSLARKGWTTPQKMMDSTWEERVSALDQASYVRYDESTSRELEDMAKLLQDKYRGDLKNLRRAAGNEPAQERKLLKEFKGIGNVGADIFFREAQAVWPELYPYVDQSALKSAQQLGLPSDPEKLSELVPKEEFPAFIAGLIRVKLNDDYEAVKN